MESGGNYKALGPVTNKGDRAYGAYQVMGSNIPSWTKEVLGTSMSAQEFLHNHTAQDAVAEAKLGQYQQTHGNMADAVAMWHSGKPYTGNNRRDVNMSTRDYTRAVGNIYNKLVSQ
jgi:hypothetical protein